MSRLNSYPDLNLYYFGEATLEFRAEIMELNVAPLCGVLTN